MEWNRLILWNRNLIVLWILLWISPLITANTDTAILTHSDYIKERLSAAHVREKRSVRNDPSLDALPINPAFSARDSDLISFHSILDCDHISNGLVRQYNNTLYLLSGIQLFRLDVTPNSQVLYPLATFETFSEVATDFSVQLWDDKMFVIFAFATHYSVHQFPNGPHDKDFKSFNLKRHALQKIPIYPGHLRSIKVMLFAGKESLHLLRAETNDQNSSTIIS